MEIGEILGLHFFDRQTRILNHRGVPLGWYPINYGIHDALTVWR